MFHLKAFITCLLVTICLTLPAQNRRFVISGIVTDSVTGKPLGDVNISLIGMSGKGITNQAGEFYLEIHTLPSVLYFSYVGYNIGSLMVDRSNQKNIRISLSPEIQEVPPVTIRAEPKIAKIIRGDTLNILDYELVGDRLILLASPYRDQADIRLYLTNLQGDALDFIRVKKPGKQIKYPENMNSQLEFLIRDFTGQVNYLDKSGTHEIRQVYDKLLFGYDTPL